MLYFSSILELFTFVLHGNIPYTLISLISLLCYTVETPFIAHLHSCIYFSVGGWSFLLFYSIFFAHWLIVSNDSTTWRFFAEWVRNRAWHCAFCNCKILNSVDGYWWFANALTRKTACQGTPFVVHGSCCCCCWSTMLMLMNLFLRRVRVAATLLPPRRNQLKSHSG